jgi:hypothetical protein
MRRQEHNHVVLGSGIGFHGGKKNFAFLMVAFLADKITPNGPFCGKWGIFNLQSHGLEV